jgi:hypothetical protein
MGRLFEFCNDGRCGVSGKVTTGHEHMALMENDLWLGHEWNMGKIMVWLLRGTAFSYLLPLSNFFLFSFVL